MKKTIMFAAVALLALVSCKKQEMKYVETSGEIAFKPISGVVTRAAGSGPEITGTEFASTNTLMVAASTKENADYFGTGATGFQFVHESDGIWKGNTAVYWPAGQQRVDFLAYGMKEGAVLGVVPAFDATRPADMLTVADWDVYTNQVDFIYAAANNKFKTDGVDPVAMQFQHSTAMIIFNFGVSEGPAISIESIDFDALAKQGTFRVDNTKTQLSTRWYGLTTATIGEVTPGAGLAAHDTQFPAAAAATAKSHYNSEATADNAKYGDSVAAASPVAYGQLGESFLIIPQERQSFLITYKIGTDNTLYTFHCDMNKGEWEAGKIYIYDIDFNLREIKIAPTVKEWVLADGMPETL